jgi:type II secretory pathway component GspD/PulD (secretin)
MKRITVGSVAAGLAVVLGLGWYAAAGQDKERPAAPKGEDGAAKDKRIAYFVKYGSAKDLAAVLGRHFKGAAEVETLPGSPSNCLLIRATPAAFPEVARVLDALDRRPHLIAVDILVAETPAKKGEAEKGLDEKDFTGPAADVLAKVEALQKKGQIGSLTHLQLTAVENQPVSVTVGGSKAYTTGMTARAGGPVARMISYRSVGTTVKVTPQVVADKVVMLDLDVQDARPHVPDDGPVIGKDENGAPVRATDFLLSKLNAKLGVPSGQAVLAKGVKTTSKSGNVQVAMIVTARVIEAEAKPGN